MFVPWTDPRLVLDLDHAVGSDHDSSVQQVVCYLNCPWMAMMYLVVCESESILVVVFVVVVMVVVVFVVSALEAVVSAAELVVHSEDPEVRHLHHALLPCHQQSSLVCQVVQEELE